MHDPCVTLPDKDVYTISTKYRYFLFVTILLANVGTQDGWASIGSSMEDLRINLKVTHAQIIAVTTVFPYSYVIGCASAYFTLDRFNRQLQYCLALFTFSVSMVLISFCSQMSHLTVSMVICGFSNAYTDTISITWTIELFRNRTQVALLVVFLFLSIGSTLSPLLMSPFVTTLDTNAVDFDLQATEPNHRIRIPFLSLAAYIFSCAILHLLSFSYKRYTGPKRNAQTYPFPEQRLNLICYPGNNQKTFQNDDHLTDLQKKMFRDDNGELKTYYWIFISLSVVVSSLIMFLQTNFAMLFSMFFHLHLPVKMTEATLYSSITSITATIALFLFVFVALHVNNFYLLYFNISCWFIGCVVIISACRVSQFWLVSGNILIGLGISSAYPMYLAFVENRITVTNRISALQLFCACILSSLTPVLIGQYMEKNPIIFIWVNLGTICILIVVFISMHLMDLWIKAIESKCYD